MLSPTTLVDRLRPFVSRLRQLWTLRADLDAFAALTREFLSGGAVIQAFGASTTVQIDGDVHSRLRRALLDRQPEVQSRALRAHFRIVQKRLLPLRAVERAIWAFRQALVVVGVAIPVVSEAIRQFEGWREPAFWLPYALAAGVLLFRQLAPRLLWRMMRRRMAAWLDHPASRSGSPG